ncbi:hypothetical protein J6590_088906 [Homalodisca vitripennis]|nr:hypothetical protein J6590_088906 [Homalodisca vitripennis]
MPKKKVVLAAAAAFAAATVICSRQRRERRYWIKPSLQARKRYSGSDLLKDLNEDDRNDLNYEVRWDGNVKNFPRMTSVDFEHLLITIGHKITKQDTSFRDAIPAREKLAITLQFLASGDSLSEFKLPVQSVKVNYVIVHSHKQDTSFRDAIPAREKLAITLQFLASGDSLSEFKLPVQSVKVNYVIVHSHSL